MEELKELKRHFDRITSTIDRKETELPNELEDI